MIKRLPNLTVRTVDFGHDEGFQQRYIVIIDREDHLAFGIDHTFVLTIVYRHKVVGGFFQIQIGEIGDIAFFRVNDSQVFIGLYGYA